MKPLLALLTLLLACLGFGQVAPTAQAILASASFAGAAGADIGTLPGWSKLGGGASLTLDGAGGLTGSIAGGSCAFVQSAAAPGSAPYTVTVHVALGGSGDDVGPIVASDAGSRYLTAIVHAGAFVVFQSSPETGWQVVSWAPIAGTVPSEYDLTGAVNADGTATFRIGDGSTASFSFRPVIPLGRYGGIYFARAATGPLAHASAFRITGTATAGTPGILHTTAHVVDVRASSSAEAIALAATVSGTDLRLDSEGYEAATLPADGVYPATADIATAWSDASTTVDLPSQVGYQPSPLPVVTTGPRSASGVYRVWVIDREAAPTVDLATAQAWTAAYYAPFVAMGGPLSMVDYLQTVPWTDWLTNNAAPVSFTVGATAATISPLRWAPFRALAAKSTLPRIYSVTKPSFAIPVDPAIAAPQASTLAVPYQAVP